MSQRPLVGIGVIIRKDDQILLMKRQNSHGDGTWSVSGGHLEYSETPQECAMREALEETGVSIANPTFLPMKNLLAGNSMPSTLPFCRDMINRSL